MQTQDGNSSFSVKDLDSSYGYFFKFKTQSAMTYNSLITTSVLHRRGLPTAQAVSFVVSVEPRHDTHEVRPKTVS